MEGGKSVHILGVWYNIKKKIDLKLKSLDALSMGCFLITVYVLYRAKSIYGSISCDLTSSRIF